MFPTPKIDITNNECRDDMLSLLKSSANVLISSIEYKNYKSTNSLSMDVAKMDIKNESWKLVVLMVRE